MVCMYVYLYAIGQIYKINDAEYVFYTFFFELEISQNCQQLFMISTY